MRKETRNDRLLGEIETRSVFNLISLEKLGALSPFMAEKDQRESSPLLPRLREKGKPIEGEGTGGGRGGETLLLTGGMLRGTVHPGAVRLAGGKLGPTGLGFCTPGVGLASHEAGETFRFRLLP